MEKSIQIEPIGRVEATNQGFIIKLKDEYKSALTNLEGFSHLQIIWWGNLFDKEEYRSVKVTDKPYSKGPEKLGIFATRSQIRPNPILLTTVFVQEIDSEQGIIRTPYIDAEPATPVLDIKPYHTSDRVRDCRVPEWCEHWPKWDEDTGSFDWAAEFNF